MYKILNFFSHFILISHRTPLIITDFKEVRYVSSEMSAPNDHFVYKKPGGILLEYYNNKDVKIGYIRYYITTGQIGLFFIDKEYQNRGLGKQILSKVIKELKNNNCEEVWAVTTKNHTFWSNVYNKSFVPRDPAHPTVTGDGYFIDLATFD
jgi:GNAT superfamily N-acetyltransferase